MLAATAGIRQVVVIAPESDATAAAFLLGVVTAILSSGVLAAAAVPGIAVTAQYT